MSDILAGRLKFGNEVGGNSAEIEVFSGSSGSGIRPVVKQKIGEWGDVLTKTSKLQTGVQVVFAVASLPNGVGISTAAQVTGAVYPVIVAEAINQRLFLITRGQPDERLERVIARCGRWPRAARNTAPDKRRSREVSRTAGRPAGA